MDLTRHCELCDNQKTDLKIGTTCGLTDRKPDFNKTCPKLKLTDKFENKLKSVNIEYQNIKRKKSLTYLFFVVFITIGISVIVGGYLLGKYALDSGVISTVPLIIMGVGLGPLGMAFGTLNKFRQDIEIAKMRKDKIDEVLREYRIKYDIEIIFGKEIHGIQEAYAELKIKGV
jgi:hypothetical protein